MFSLKSSRYYLLFFISLGFNNFIINFAVACPDVDGLADLNCDGRVEIACFGDSVTYGIGDGAKLGYPGRLQQLFPHVTIKNFGLPGEDTYEGLKRATGIFNGYKTADYVIILEGINDYYYAARSPVETRDNLLTMSNRIDSNSAGVLLANLTENRKGFQRPWVVSVNKAINPFIKIDFFSLGSTIVGADRLHPNSRGYQQMALRAMKTLLLYSNKRKPADSDGDLIPDFFEQNRYHTNPFNADTDGDGISDEDEIFKYHSNPLALDSDGDGISDNYEILVIGSDPNDSRPTPPKLLTLEVTGKAE